MANNPSLSGNLPPLDIQRAPEGGDIGAIQSGWRLALREFLSNRLAVIGFGMLIFFVLFRHVLTTSSWSSFGFSLQRGLCSRCRYRS